MTECMGHEIEPQTEAHRLLQNASMTRSEAGQMFSAIHAQQAALVNKAMEAGRLEQQATTAKGYIKRLRAVAS